MNYNLSIDIAKTKDDFSAIASLRYRVFQEQFGANGKSFNHVKKIEWDIYDESCEHIICKIMCPRQNQMVIGTFRFKIATNDDAKYQVQNEFNIDNLLLQNQKSCELGRICIDARFRDGITIFKIWQFLFNHLKNKKVKILFGVASFKGCDPKMHEDTLHVLFKKYVSPLTAQIKSIQKMNLKVFPDLVYDEVAAIKNIPDLLKAYLRFGSRVSPSYFIDIDFNTVDLCCVLMLNDIPLKQNKFFSSGLIS